MVLVMETMAIIMVLVMETMAIIMVLVMETMAIIIMVVIIIHQAVQQGTRPAQVALLVKLNKQRIM
jgi:hypothetical protein